MIAEAQALVKTSIFNPIREIAKLKDIDEHFFVVDLLAFIESEVLRIPLSPHSLLTESI